MKTLVLEIPPASSCFVLTLLCGWVKMKCNKLESIQSCEFWQELKKMEGDRYDERAKDNMSLPPPTHHLLLGTLPVSYLSPSVHTQRERCNHKDTVSHTYTHTHPHTDIILSVAAPLHSLILFQSTYSVGLCTCIRYMVMSMHTHESAPTNYAANVWGVNATQIPCDQYVHIGS